jgi:hypothetical protein
LNGCPASSRPAEAEAVLLCIGDSLAKTLETVRTGKPSRLAAHGTRLWNKPDPDTWLDHLTDEKFKKTGVKKIEPTC